MKRARTHLLRILILPSPPCRRRECAKDGENCPPMQRPGGPRYRPDSPRCVDNLSPPAYPYVCEHPNDENARQQPLRPSPSGSVAPLRAAHDDRSRCQKVTSVGNRESRRIRAGLPSSSPTQTRGLRTGSDCIFPPRPPHQIAPHVSPLRVGREPALGRDHVESDFGGSLSARPLQLSYHQHGT